MRVLEVLMVLCVAGCGGGPLEPAELVLNEEACSLCRMAVSERPFAAQAVTRSGRTDFFDDIGCLAQWASGQEESAVFVADYETGDWLDARKAHYVSSERLQTPMASGLAAFGTRERASFAAEKLGGRVLDWGQVRREQRK